MICLISGYSGFNVVTLNQYAMTHSLQNKSKCIGFASRCALHDTRGIFGQRLWE
ncbi:hypothetical protein Syun_027921 [Stephania yunnanensis]|uniref:Uncharacterized protein n=1 Tax=Stephania yunnanensis TaxID=152371 RepID=A0AAP0EGF0_9MAGN